jgi:hypothetical protein
LHVATTGQACASNSGTNAMIKYIPITIIALALATLVHADEPKYVKPGKISATFTIKYNSVTLEEAAEHELRIRSAFGEGSCNIGLKVGAPSGNLFLTAGDGLTFE